MFNVFADVRPQERRLTIAAFFSLFGILAGHSLLETARDALFLSDIPADRLPWVYLAIAILSLGIYAVQARRPQQARGGVLPLLALAAVVNLGLFALIQTPGHWKLYLIYIWSGLFSTLVLIRFWLQVSNLYTVTQAKRVFALIGAGSVAGAIVGTLAARVLTEFFGADSLLVASAIMFLITGLVPVRILMRTPGPSGMTMAGATPPPASLRRALRTFRNRPYVRQIGWIVLVSTVAVTLVDFLFKAEVADRIAPGDLGAFFATAYLLFNVLSLGAQVFLVSRLMRNWGVYRVLSALPLLLGAGAVTLVAGGGLFAALGLKAADGALRHSLHRTALEVLYVPLTPEQRTRVKGFVDVLGQRGGQALASLVILGSLALGPSQPVLAGLVLALAVGWILLARALRNHYLNVFRDQLSEGAFNTRFEFPEIDVSSLETLIVALNSPNDDEVIAVMDILAEQDRSHLIPALILYHPSSPVVLRALEIFTAAGRNDVATVTARLLEHQDPEIRAAALRTRSWLDPSPELSERMADDPSPLVRTTAWIGMVSYGSERGAEARHEIEELAATGSMQERLALARAVRYSPGAVYADVLLTMAAGPEEELRLEVARAMREVQSTRFLPALLDMLGVRRLRSEARSTLVALGPEAFDHVASALSDPGVDDRIRRHLPRTLAQFEPASAMAVLVERLPVEPDGAVRYRLLRAVGRLRSRNPDLPLDLTVINEELEHTVSKAYRLINWRVLVYEGNQRLDARRTPVQGLIVALIEHRERLALERVFRYLQLIHVDEDLASVYRGMHSRDETIRAGGQELLENLLHSPLREAVVGLVEDLDAADRLRRARTYHNRLYMEYTDLLEDLLTHGSVGMRCLVIYHAGELGLDELREVIEGVPRDDDGLVNTAIQRTLSRFDATREAASG